MSDLIDRQQAIDALAKVAREHFNLSDEFNHYLAGLIDGEIAIRRLPSAQPEIIRCKECIYFDKYIDCKEMYQWDGFCADWARNTYENWYCSRAERRSDG